MREELTLIEKVKDIENTTLFNVGNMAALSAMIKMMIVGRALQKDEPREFAKRAMSDVGEMVLDGLPGENPGIAIIRGHALEAVRVFAEGIDAQIVRFQALMCEARSRTRQ